jgi:hypothetical protein
VKKTQLFERARPSEATKYPWGEFCVFSEEEEKLRKLAASKPLNRTERFFSSDALKWHRTHVVLFFDGAKKEQRRGQKKENQPKK